MTQKTLENEKNIMIMVRKTLSGVIRDVTPLPGTQGVLKDETVESLRLCLGVISNREQQIAQELGRDIKERPRYADEPKTSHVVQFSSNSAEKKS